MRFPIVVIFIVKYTIMGEKKYKHCSVCNKELPANRKYFKRHGDDTLHDICRICEDREKHDKEWKDGMLLCHKCGKFLPVDNFAKSDHYLYRDCHDARCRNCKTKRANEIKKSFTSDIALLKILQIRFLCAKERASRKNIPFDITKDYLKELWKKQNGRCAISNIPMTFELGNGRTPTNISLDQIDHKKGYTIGNTQLVCMAVNQMKSDLQMDELYMFCENILSNKILYESSLNETSLI